MDIILSIVVKGVHNQDMHIIILMGGVKKMSKVMRVCGNCGRGYFGKVCGICDFAFKKGKKQGTKEIAIQELELLKIDMDLFLACDKRIIKSKGANVNYLEGCIHQLERYLGIIEKRLKELEGGKK